MAVELRIAANFPHAVSDDQRHRAIVEIRPVQIAHVVAQGQAPALEIFSFIQRKLGRDGARCDNREHGAQQRSVSDHDYSVIRI